MRFEKGGVVDLAQEDRKKNKNKYKIKKDKHKVIGKLDNIKIPILNIENKQLN